MNPWPVSPDRLVKHSQANAEAETAKALDNAIADMIDANSTEYGKTLVDMIKSGKVPGIGWNGKSPE